MVKDIKVSTPTGHCLFCDDIRHEINGKFSLIGNYGSDLRPFTSFPLVLPKLCVYLSYFQRPVDGFQDVKFEIVLNSKETNTTVWEILVQGSSLENAPRPEATDEQADPVIGIHVPLEFQNFVINETGYLRVYAQRGDERMRIGSLKIEQPTTPQDAKPIN